MYRILILEDDDALRNGIVYALTKEGYTAEATDSLKGLSMFPLSSIDALLLDVTLSDGDSREYLKELRKSSNIPVIFLTAHNTEIDMIKGFDAGADDYVTKPFSIPLLVRRLKAVLSRSHLESRYYAGNLIYDFQEKILFKDGVAIPLSKTEVKLVEFFIKNRNQVLTWEILLERIWDIDGNFVDKNTLSVNIARLREKIEDDRKHPRWIKNVFGIGYKWSDRDEG